MTIDPFVQNRIGSSKRNDWQRNGIRCSFKTCPSRILRDHANYARKIRRDERERESRGEKAARNSDGRIEAAFVGANTGACGRAGRRRQHEMQCMWWLVCRRRHQKPPLVCHTPFSTLFHPFPPIFSPFQPFSALFSLSPIRAGAHVEGQGRCHARTCRAAVVQYTLHRRRGECSVTRCHRRPYKRRLLPHRLIYTSPNAHDTGKTSTQPDDIPNISTTRTVTWRLRENTRSIRYVVSRREGKPSW